MKLTKLLYSLLSSILLEKVKACALALGCRRGVDQRLYQRE